VPAGESRALFSAPRGAFFVGVINPSLSHQSIILPLKTLPAPAAHTTGLSNQPRLNRYAAVLELRMFVHHIETSIGILPHQGNAGAFQRRPLPIARPCPHQLPRANSLRVLYWSLFSEPHSADKVDNV